MSANYSVRSLGHPYFAAVQADQSFMDSATAPKFDVSGGSASVYIDFMVHSMPTALASADELHELFSYHESDFGGVDLVRVGITPSGKLRAYNAGAAGSVETVLGYIAPGIRYRVEYRMNTASHELRLWQWLGDPFTSSIAVEGPLLVTASHAPWLELTVGSGKLGRLMLFNGREGKSRCACSIYSARVSGINCVFDWQIAERSGDLLADTQVALSADYDFNADLGLGYYDPLFSYPWGTFPSTDPTASYEWELTTDWTKRELPETVWAKRAS